VVGKSPVIEPNYEYTVTDGQKYYDHCKTCDTGVFLPEKQTNVIRCTYCGVLKETVSEKKP
jgi:DNA-directed RNA polymerase subunit RPC12/RpoP